MAEKQGRDVAQLEDLTAGTTVTGIVPDAAVTVIGVTWFGTNAIEVTYKDPAGRVGSQLLYGDQEPQIQIAQSGLPWSFDGDGCLFRLASEAYRIRLAYLFDPLLAVHTSLVEPLPHQITAVYEAMLPRQPLRFLLADDPGAGKTIMTGLLIKELLIRGDLHRCLIVCPGALVEQWQDELYHKFGLDFTIITRESAASTASGRPRCAISGTWSPPRPVRATCSSVSSGSWSRSGRRWAARCLTCSVKSSPKWRARRASRRSELCRRTRAGV
jgi:hypothetical protein